MKYLIWLYLIASLLVLYSLFVELNNNINSMKYLKEFSNNESVLQLQKNDTTYNMSDSSIDSKDTVVSVLRHTVVFDNNVDDFSLKPSSLSLVKDNIRNIGFLSVYVLSGIGIHLFYLLKKR